MTGIIDALASPATAPTSGVSSLNSQASVPASRHSAPATTPRADSLELSGTGQLLTVLTELHDQQPVNVMQVVSRMAFTSGSGSSLSTLTQLLSQNPMELVQVVSDVASQLSTFNSSK